MEGEEDRVEGVKHEMGDWHKEPECVSACETDGGGQRKLTAPPTCLPHSASQFIYFFFLYWSSTGSSLGSGDRQADRHTQNVLYHLYKVHRDKKGGGGGVKVFFVT